MTKENKYIGGLILILLAIAGGIIYISNKNYAELSGPDKENKTEESPALAPQSGLPEKVEATRQAIYRAALEKNYEKLAAIATYANFAYSFGGPYETGFAGFLKLSAETEGESAFDIIPKLLRLPYSFSGGIYSWPAVFNKEPEDWTEEDISMMKTLFSDADIERYREFGGYIYYRLGIDDKGNWIYYIAGD